MPSVGETVRKYAGLSSISVRSVWRGVLLFVAVLIGLPLILPPIDLRDPSGVLPLLLVLLGPIVGSAHQEHRFGSSPRLVLAAALTKAVLGLIALAIFLAVSGTIGGRAQSANPFVWFFSLPMEVQIWSLIGLMVALVVAFYLRKPARERAAAAFEAEVRAERARRGVDPAA
jgi:hypothetical protein